MWIREKFWKKIAELRKERWLSQEKLATMSWIHRTYISEIERWKTNISLDHIENLSYALWVDLSYLFKDLWKNLYMQQEI